MGLVGQLVSGFGWANGFGLFLPPLIQAMLGRHHSLVKLNKVLISDGSEVEHVTRLIRLL